MGFLGLFKFAFKFFDLLAWHLFGLGFPVYASIRAIENNSSSDMRNLVAYWIIFSLISLFELAFVKLIDWLPFWPYMKLMAVCWLVLPDIHGASYVYDLLLRPCLSVYPQVVIKYLIKPKEYESLGAENFLAVAERYVQENGSEALEKLLVRKSINKEPDVAKEDARAVELPEKNSVAVTKSSKVKEPNVAMENANAGQSKVENPEVATEQVKCVDLNLAENGKQTVAAGETKESTVAAAGGEFKAAETTDSEKVQREWTCALCQLTITCEKNLESHFQGKKHKAKCEGLKASKEVNKEPNGAKEDAGAVELREKNPVAATKLVKWVDPNLAQNEKKTVAAGENKESTVAAAGGKNKTTETTDAEKVQREWTCALCQVTTTSEKILESHFQGRKHKAKCERLKASKQMNENMSSSSSEASPGPNNTLSVDRPCETRSEEQEDKVKMNRTNEQCKEKEVDNAGGGMNQSKYWCSICDIKLLSEIDVATHIGGKRHLNKTR